MYSIIKLIMFFASLHQPCNNVFFQAIRKQYYHFFGGTITSPSGIHYIIELKALRDIEDIEFQCVYTQNRWISDLQVYSNNQLIKKQNIRRDDVIRLECTLWFQPQHFQVEQQTDSSQNEIPCAAVQELPEHNPPDCIVFFHIHNTQHMMCLRQFERLPNKNHP